MSPPLLAVENLRTEFHTDAGVVKAVDGSHFDSIRVRSSASSAKVGPANRSLRFRFYD